VLAASEASAARSAATAACLAAVAAVSLVAISRVRRPRSRARAALSARMTSLDGMAKARRGSVTEPFLLAFQKAQNEPETLAALAKAMPPVLFRQVAGMSGASLPRP
jgi:hypothetical protein